MTIDKNKIGRLLVCIGGAGLVIGIIAFTATRSPRSDTPQEGQTKNEFVDVPQAEETTIQGSKSTAYRDYREEKDNSSIENYWDRCEEAGGAPEQSSSMSYPAGHSHRDMTSSELFSTPGPSPAPRKNNTYSNPYRETPQQREERHQRRHEEAKELAEQMTNGKESKQDEQEQEKDPPESQIAQTVVRRSGGISSLDQWDNDSGISSLDDTTDLFLSDAERPIRCMFARESKIKGGQRAAIILLEDLVINGVLVPKNTHLMAFCNISGRLEMKIPNIEIGGRIIPLDFEAYDNDGNLGIYCPDVGNTGQTVRNRGTRMIGSGLSGKMGRTAGEIISTGVSLIQNASGEKTVTVPAGYTFFIVKKKQ